MPEADDHRLLTEFARAGSESAFATLVARYVNLVFSTAFRSTGNAQNAEEITQTVFIVLARKAEILSPRVVLSGWLYQTTRLTAANFMKAEFRRRRREEEAAMQSILNEPSDAAWPEIAPLLDEAIGHLGQTDRDALLLRYFENKSTAEIGAALRMNEDTARRRVNRALEKLRRFFLKCGVASTAATIGESISTNSVQAAPVSLAKSVTAAAITKGAAASTSTLTLMKGVLKIMAWSKMKTATVGTVILAIAAATTVVIQQEIKHRSPHSVVFDKASFVYAGYRTPEKTVQTMLWAMAEGDSDAFLTCCTPGEKVQREKAWAGETKEEVSAKGKEQVASMGRIRILNQTNISASQMILTVLMEGSGHTETMLFSRIGDDWKYDKEVHESPSRSK